MCHFSVKRDNSEFLGLNLEKLPNYMLNFGSNNFEGVAESWVEVEMSYVDGGGWSLVKVGAQFSNTYG